MGKLLTYLNSSIGRKKIVGITGLGLCLFVLSHMLGNLLLFVSPQAYNLYSHTLISNPLIYVAEGGLVLIFLVHVFLAIKLARENKKARPQGYDVGLKGEQQAKVASKTMVHTGSIVFIFLVLHLITFKYGTYYSVTYNGVEMRDLHRLVLEVFQSPAYLAWYLICMVLLWFHLSHGFASSFQSLGVNRPIGRLSIMKWGYLFAAVVAGGFFLQPIYAFLSKCGCGGGN